MKEEPRNCCSENQKLGQYEEELVKSKPQSIKDLFLCLRGRPIKINRPQCSNVVVEMLLENPGNVTTGRALPRTVTSIRRGEEGREDALPIRRKENDWQHLHSYPTRPSVCFSEPWGSIYNKSNFYMWAAWYSRAYTWPLGVFFLCPIDVDIRTHRFSDASNAGAPFLGPC